MNLVLTLDYELYGDGSGNVFTEMIYPTNKILSICDKNHIKTTIFFEVIEYIHIRNEWLKGNKMGYSKNPIEAIENQLKKALKNGHDIQLHIHPQWVGARFIKDKWQVNMDNWRLGDFSHKNYTIKELIKEGKDTIENLLKPVDSNYKCIAIRAGGYNVMPSKDLYKAMLDLGMKFDSSVYPGGFEQGELSKFDYRNSPISRDLWIGDKEDISKPSKNKIDEFIYEIPIFAIILPRWKKINIYRLKSFFKNRKSSIKAFKAKATINNKQSKLKYYIGREAITWDFCLFQMSLHKYFFNYIDKDLKNKRNSFVLIGHPKGFTNEKNFKMFINYAFKKGFSFSSLKDFYLKILNE